jgi:hypothetical protein
MQIGRTCMTVPRSPVVVVAAGAADVDTTVAATTPTSRTSLLRMPQG